MGPEERTLDRPGHLDGTAVPPSPLHGADRGRRRLLLLENGRRRRSHTVTSNMWLPTVRGLSELQMGWSGPPGGVRGTFEPPSAARSGVKRAPGGARKAMILWPWRLLPGTSLALQTNTRSCSMSRLLQDMIRVTSSVFALSDLKRETEKTVLAVVRMKPLFAGTAQHVNCLNYRCVFYSFCGDKRAHFLIISFMICFDIL